MIDNTAKSIEIASARGGGKLYHVVLYMLGTYIFLNPFPATSPKEIIFYSMALVFICTAFNSRARFSLRSPLTIPFSLFAVWAFLSVIFALDIPASLNDYFAHLIKLFLLYYMLINFFNSSKRLEILSWLIILSAAIFALAISIHWYLVLGQPLSSRLGLTYATYGTITNGYYTVFGLALALRQLAFEKSRLRGWTLWAAIILLAAASILSQARSTLLALLVVTGILYLRKARLLFGIVLFLAAVIAILPVKNRLVNWVDYSPRFGQYFYTSEIIKDNPVFGIGFSVDTFRDESLIDREHYMARIPEQFQNPAHPYLWPHNMFLSTAVRAGLPGGVLFLFFFIVPAVMGWKLSKDGYDDTIKSWGLCGLACLGMFFVKGNLDQAFLSAIENIFFSILAIITIAWNLHQQMEPAKVGSDTSEKKGAKGAG